MTSRIRTHGLIAVAVVLAVVGAAGFSAAALESQQDQKSRRLKQLAVFEELLTETVQEQVTASVNATIDAARRGDPDGDGVVEGIGAEPLVVKVGRPLAAHGLYIDGYGVMFSIQTPQVTVIPQSFQRVFAQPRAVFRMRSSDEGAGPEAIGIIELRADMIDRSIDDLIVLLERQPDDLHEVRVQELEGLKVTLEGLRGDAATPHTVEVTAVEVEGELARVEALEEDDAEQVDAAESAYGRARDLSRRNRWQVYYRDTLAQRDSLKGVLERNYRQVAAAMNAAAIETLASYGALIKGLDDDERITVVVLPPNTWSFASGYGVGLDQDEHVISARYKDIRDLDNEKIDYDEFVKRAQIRDRLGLEVAHVEQD